MTAATILQPPIFLWADFRRYLSPMKTIVCARCGQERDQMPFRPFQNEIGLRVYEQICNVCWQEWLTTQKQLMNHYSLDPREPQSKVFLFDNMEKFLFQPKVG